MLALLLSLGVGFGGLLILLSETPNRNWGPLWLQELGSRTSVSLSGRSSSKPKIWLQRAQFRERVGDAEGALTAYGRALASSDEGLDQKAFLRRAQLLKRLNRDHEALRDYTSAIGIGDREAPAAPIGAR